MKQSLEESKSLKIVFVVFDYVKTAFVLVVIVLLAYYLIFQASFVRGQSMDPNFEDGQLILVDRATYYFSEPVRGDAVVFVFPGTDNEKYIKRIIGLPGEKVAVKDRKIYINGKQLKEDYLEVATVTTGDTELVLSKDEYFVLGDNREVSNDSRVWGSLNKENIIGKVRFVVFPFAGKFIIERPAYNI